MAEVEKDYIEDCKEFDAQLWNDYSYGVIALEPSGDN